MNSFVPLLIAACGRGMEKGAGIAGAFFMPHREIPE